jgi:hypothetical protein
MSEAERCERPLLIAALARVSMLCDFRPVTTTRKEVEHLLAAVDSVRRRQHCQAGEAARK